MKIRIELNDESVEYHETDIVRVESEQLVFGRDTYDYYRFEDLYHVSLDGETIYSSNKYEKDNQEKLQAIIDEYGSLGEFWQHVFNVVNGKNRGIY